MAPDGDWVEAILRYTPPLDSKSLLPFLDARVIPGVEECVDGVYRRSLELAGGPSILELEPVLGGVRARYRLAAPRDVLRILSSSASPTLSRTFRHGNNVSFWVM